MFRKILELRVLNAIIQISKEKPDGGIDYIHFINDALFAALNDEERQKFTRLFFEYPEFKDRYSEPRVAPYNPDELAKLPSNTLGYHYAKFMKDHNFLVNWYVHMEEKSPLHFARNRQYETHDILHTITDCKGTPIDEIRLQGFYTGQGVPNPTAMAVFTAATLNKLQKNEPKANMELMDHITAGYIMGKNAKRVMFRKWEDDWARDIDELREELGIRLHVGSQA